MESRRLTFSLKPKGKDKKHDVAFDLLKHLPKGYRADLVAQAVYEYIMSREGIHMVREQNGVKIINLGKAEPEAWTAALSNMSERQEHQHNGALGPMIEPEPASEPYGNEGADENGGGDNALDSEIAAWFSE